MRDRHLETIRRWPKNYAINPEIADNRVGRQVGKQQSKRSGPPINWRQILPLINIKLRPKDAPKDSVIYSWGAIILTGPFIIDLDNPWALTGYNLWAFWFVKPIIKRLLLSPKCYEIRCLSQACRTSLKLLLGDEVYEKSTIHYPPAPPILDKPSKPSTDNPCKFLFIGTQFDIKGGPALLKAFEIAYKQNQNIQLDIITHLPREYTEWAKHIPNVYIYPPHFRKEAIYNSFMRDAHVLIHPTYIESFGMVILEAMTHGLAIIATDVYAIHEMVKHKKNGILIDPPISCWDNFLPSHLYKKINKAKDIIREVDTTKFSHSLAQAILNLSLDKEALSAAQNQSLIIARNIAKVR